MSGLAANSSEYSVCQFLLDVGIRGIGLVRHYLSDAIVLVLDGAQPGRELWERVAHKYGKRAVNVRSACRRAIQKAYHNSPEDFCAALHDIYFIPPRTGDFIVAAAKAILVATTKETG